MLFNSICLAATLAAVSHAQLIHVRDESFIDPMGRQVIFHGVNVVYKVDPYIPDTEEFSVDDSLNDEDIDNLVKWGMNFVRLGVMWEAVERTPGVYDNNYLTKID
jgi:endoglycosylceramidase